MVGMGSEKVLNDSSFGWTVNMCGTQLIDETAKHHVAEKVEFVICLDRHRH